MKSGFTRLISLILTLALIISCFAVFAYAETEGEDTEQSGKNPVVVYNRDFADGWPVYNGLGDESSIEKDHNFYVDSELTADYSYNYFARFESTNASDGFAQLSFADENYPDEDKIFIDFDLMADDYLDADSILYFRTKGGATNGLLGTLLRVKTNTLYLFDLSVKDPEQETMPVDSDWIHISIVFDYTPYVGTGEDEDYMFDVVITATSEDKEITERRSFDRRLYTGTNVKPAQPGYIGLDFLRFGYGNESDPQKALLRAGASFCIDNLVAYYGCTEPLTEEQVNAQGYGTLVKLDQIKTVNIVGSAQDKTELDYLNEALIMKLGVDGALLNNKKISLSGIDNEYVPVPSAMPTTYNGIITVPLAAILEYVGYPAYVHAGGASIDISTGAAATYITMGQDTAIVEKETVKLTMAPGYHPELGSAIIALDDVETLFPGYYVTYDTMGLIIICQRDDILNREEHLETMLSLMKRFVFDLVDTDSTYNDVTSEHVKANAATVYNDVVENTNLTHPYLIADQEKFDQLIAIWNGTDTTEYDVDIKGTIESNVKWAYSLLHAFALPSRQVQVGVYLDPTTGEEIPQMKDYWEEWVGFDLDNTVSGLTVEYRITQPYVDPSLAEDNDGDGVADGHYDPYGYDVGGRIGDAGETLEYAKALAFGYAITGDIMLAKCAYHIMVAVGEWDHWGPGHFLNVSEASIPYSLSLDWIYNGIVALDDPDYDVEYLEEMLFTHGVYMGYIATTGKENPWPRNPKVGSDVWRYSTMDNNWNSVCTAGMWMASLALLGSDASVTELLAREFDGIGYKYQTDGVETVSEMSALLLAMNIESMALYGLDLYAPDGSYKEGPGYWGYGTNYLLYGIMALWVAAGDDYGLLDCAGFDRTCYYACAVESSDFKFFNYSDSSIGGSVNSCSFFFVAEALGDPALAEIRKLQIPYKGMDLRDLFFYPFESDGEDAVEVELPLDYSMEGIGGYSTRSSWESGALFAAISGGDSSITHAQTDSGTFVYHNKGTIWITDLGNDEYNTFEYFTTPTRYRYYRNNAEGNNVLALTSDGENVPHGQKINGCGTLAEHGSNEYGSYAIIENTSVYGDSAVTARRGMLLTNDRKTVVIQDEVVLSKQHTLQWFAHFDYSKVKYDISDNGRTLYLYTVKNVASGNSTYEIKTNMVRLSLVSSMSSLKFVVTGCSSADFQLTDSELGTVHESWSQSQGGLAEKDRSNYRRIAIKANGVNLLDLAVVIELLDLSADNEGKDLEVGYTFTPMSEWTPSADTRDGSGNDVTEDTDVALRATPKLADIKTYMSQAGNMRGKLGSSITSFYRLLCDGCYTVNYFGDIYEQYTDYKEHIDKYSQLKKIHDDYRKSVNAIVSDSTDIIQRLMGQS